MKNQKIKDGATLRSMCGEIINVRVYSDGWVKLESLNMREDFSSVEMAEMYILNNGLVNFKN